MLGACLQGERLRHRRLLTVMSKGNEHMVKEVLYHHFVAKRERGGR